MDRLEFQGVLSALIEQGIFEPFLKDRAEMILFKDRLKNMLFTEKHEIRPTQKKKDCREANNLFKNEKEWKEFLIN